MEGGGPAGTRRSGREAPAGRGHPAWVIWGSAARVGEGRPGFALWPELGAWWRVGRGHLALGSGEDPRFEGSVGPGYWSGSRRRGRVGAGPGAEPGERAAGRRLGGTLGAYWAPQRTPRILTPGRCGEDFPLPGSFLPFQIKVDTFDSQPLWDLHNVQ